MLPTAQLLVGVGQDVLRGGAGKYRVSGEQDAVVVLIKADVPRGVTGSEDHLQQVGPHLKAFAPRSRTTWSTRPAFSMIFIKGTDWKLMKGRVSRWP